ncbi:MAG: hypothetical protein Q9M28_10875 [Mariprofundaceae bacterium]|nr:hypothetical protein [Mariprofundaceae bacterium]
MNLRCMPFILRYFTLILLLFTVLLSGCSNEYGNDINTKYVSTSKRVTQLQQQLDARKLSNASLIYSYAGALAAQKPELSQYINILRKEAGSSGASFTSLKKRLIAINLKVENRKQYEPVFKELESIWAGSDPIIYNDSLMDIVNTLADLSDGKLARINIPKKTTSDTPPGSYMVGNPSYGHWQSNSSGGNFWQWYGQYRFFSDILGGSRIYDNHYYGSNRHSYYNDWGRSTYGGYADNQRWQSRKSSLSSKGVSVKTPKSYGSTASQKRVSSYASMRKSNDSSLKSKSGPVNTKRSSSFMNTGNKTATSSSASGSNASSSSSRRSSNFFNSSRSSSSQSSRSRFGGGK